MRFLTLRFFRASRLAGIRITTKDTKDHEGSPGSRSGFLGVVGRWSISSCTTVLATLTPRYNGLAMISQDLLDMLVCPVCKKPVVPNANGGSLKCGECGRVYPIQDDIPIMLVDAARLKD